MWFFKKLNLQLFAEGEGGGEGAATGVEAVDPGQQRLRELGVPESKIRKNRQYKFATPVQKPAAAEQAKTEEKETERVAAAEKPTEEAKTPARMTWEEILADPEYKKEYDKGVQSAVVPRIKNIKQAEEILKKVAPVLELQARRYGLDENNIDYDALVKATEKDSSYYEEKSLEKGTSIEQTMDEDIKDRAQKREQREQERTLEQQMIYDHIRKLEQQGKAMREVFPNFDLQKELQNPAFARMTAPGVGLMSVEDAYRAVHRKEIEAASAQVIAQKSIEMASNAIQSGKSRPSENGTTGQAPSVATFDYSKASREQREALKKRIRSGEKIRPGQEWK